MDVVMKQWDIPVEWSMFGTVTVAAPTLKEAMRIAAEDSSIGLPDQSQSDYIDGSWKVSSYDVEEIRDILNNGQADEVDLKSKEEIYDYLCRVLTEYEDHNNMITEEDLYSLLCLIQNRWEDTIMSKEG